MWCRRSTPCSTRWQHFSNRVRSGAWKGHTGKRIRERRQHRHRRLRPRTGDGLRGTEALQRSGHDVSLRFERRRNRLRGSGPRSRSRGNAVHRLFENIHDARDDDQRPHRSRLVARCFRGRRQERSPSILSRCRRTRRKWRSSASIPTNMFEFWDWVGGRYSMDSAIGLSTMLAIGPDNFRAHAAMASIRWTSISAPLRSSATCRCSWGCWPSGTTISSAPQTVAVLPYEQYLKRFPAYLQQLTMESNGKYVTLDGDNGRLQDRPNLLGRARNQRPAFLLPIDSSGNAAHSLRLHRVRPDAQSAWPAPRHAAGKRFRSEPRRWPSARRPRRSRPRARRTGSCRTASSRATAHRTRFSPSGSPRKPSASSSPSTSTSSSRRATIWNIDSFDQWGVELGKELAQRIIPELESKAEPALTHDSSTNNLIRRYRKLKEAL